MHIGARILESNIVRKDHPIQSTSGVIACTHKCSEGVQMNWFLFLLNQLIEDAVAVQAGERPFTYSWLLILIALVAWMDPEDYQRMMVEAIEVCKNARCQKLWWVEEPSRQADCVKGRHYKKQWLKLQDYQTQQQ